MTKITATLKSVNKLGLAAILITAGILMGFNAPKTNIVAQKWAFDQSIPASSLRWVNVENLTQDNSSTPADGTYRCNASSSICTGLFDTPPTSNSANPSSGAILGSYILN